MALFVLTIILIVELLKFTLFKNKFKVVPYIVGILYIFLINYESLIQKDSDIYYMTAEVLEYYLIFLFYILTKFILNKIQELEFVEKYRVKRINKLIEKMDKEKREKFFIDFIKDGNYFDNILIMKKYFEEDYKIIMDKIL